MAPTGDWTQYAGDPGSTRFRPSSLGDRLDEVRVLHRWRLPLEPDDLDGEPVSQFGPNEGTPLKIGKSLFTVGAPSVVARFDLDTMRPGVRADGSRVVYDPKLYLEPAPRMLGFIHRGLAHRVDDAGADRLFLTRGDAVLVALDLDLEPIPSFGAGGEVDVAQGEAPRKLTITSPPAICGDVVVVGSAIADLNEDGKPARGDVRGYCATTGELRWTFETIPRGREIEGRSIEGDWRDGSNERSGHANVWAPMSVDPELGLVYLPVSSAYNDAWGGERKGDNRYSQSLVALDAATGEVRWSFQLIHHDLWDYDPPAAPVLVDVGKSGRRLVVQVTKQAFAYVFDRETGEPIWDIRECEVPGSDVPGEETSRTQPFPTRPLPFDQQGIYPVAGKDALGRTVEANVLDLSQPLREATMNVMSRYRTGPLFEPPALIDENCLGTIQFPGFLGGASWAGAVADPDRGVLYVSSVTRANVNTVRQGQAPGPPYFSGGFLSWFVKDAKAGDKPWTLPLLNPPWGRITAIDLASGEHLWQAPVGAGPRASLTRFDPEVELPDGELGWPRRTHLLATDRVLFAAQEAHRAVRAMDDVSEMAEYALQPDVPELRAHDPETGELLHRIQLGAHAQGALMHFTHDERDYIAVPTGGFDRPAEVLIVGVDREQPERETDSPQQKTVQRSTKVSKGRDTIYRRLRYEGITRYTSIETGRQTVQPETIVIVQKFEHNGSNFELVAPYKLGYVEHDVMSLRLSLAPASEPAGGAVKAPMSLVAAVDLELMKRPQDFGIGGIQTPFPTPVGGTVDMWSTEPKGDEVCWRYNDFWGAPIGRPLFEDAEDRLPEIAHAVPLFVDGWGQKTRDHLVRTMSYSKTVDGERFDVLVRSSELEAVCVEESGEEFVAFVDRP